MRTTLFFIFGPLIFGIVLALGWLDPLLGINKPRSNTYPDQEPEQQTVAALIMTSPKKQELNTALTQIVAASRPDHHSTPTTESLANPGKYIQILDNKPEETFNQLLKELELLTLQKGTAPQRADLILTIGKISSSVPGKEQQISEVAAKQLQSDDGDRTLVLSAHQTFLKVTHDPDTALNVSFEGIKRQSDPAIRERILLQFISQFPQKKDALQARLKEYRID